jgi:hypothetical protein
VVSKNEKFAQFATYPELVMNLLQEMSQKSVSTDAKSVSTYISEQAKKSDGNYAKQLRETKIHAATIASYITNMYTEYRK